MCLRVQGPSGDIRQRLVFVQRMSPAVDAEGVRKLFRECGRVVKCDRLLPSQDIWSLQFSKPEVRFMQCLISLDMFVETTQPTGSD